MSKSFTEYELPKQKELTVAVRWIDVADAGHCTFIVSNTLSGLHASWDTLCNLNASWQCSICGQWTCDLHEAKKGSFEGHAICESCGQLSRFNQEKIANFREEINS